MGAVVVRSLQGTCPRAQMHLARLTLGPPLATNPLPTTWSHCQGLALVLSLSVGPVNSLAVPAPGEALGSVLCFPAQSKLPRPPLPTTLGPGNWVLRPGTSWNRCGLIAPSRRWHGVPGPGHLPAAQQALLWHRKDTTPATLVPAALARPSPYHSDTLALARFLQVATPPCLWPLDRAVPTALNAPPPPGTWPSRTSLDPLCSAFTPLLGCPDLRAGLRSCPTSHSGERRLREVPKPPCDHSDSRNCTPLVPVCSPQTQSPHSTNLLTYRWPCLLGGSGRGQRQGAQRTSLVRAEALESYVLHQSPQFMARKVLAP